MFLILLQALALGAVWLATIVAYKRIRYSDFYRLPSPKGKLVLGHVAECSAPNMHRWIAECAHKYGSLFRVKLLGSDILMVTDPEVVGNILSKNGLNLPKAPVYEVARLFFHRTSQNNFFLTKYDDEYYKSIRKPLALAFSTDTLRDHAFPAEMALFVKLAQRIDESTRCNPGQGVNVDELLQRFTFDVSGKWGFGVDFNTLDGDNPALLDAFHRCMREFHLRMPQPFRIPLFKLLPFLPEAKKTLHALDATYKLYEDLAASVRSRGPPSPDDKSFAACLARITDPATGQPISTPQLEANLAVILIAAFDTTSHQMGWLLYDIARHPQVQCRIMDELQEAGFLCTKGREPAKQVTFNDLVRLPYINAVIREGQRYHQVTASGTMRVNDAVIKVKGVEIPKGTMVCIPHFAYNRSHRNYERADEFLPERWLVGQSADGSNKTNGFLDDKQQAGKAVQQPLDCLSFSAGPRDCLGQSLAMMTLRLLLVLLCGRYWFEVAPEMGSEEEVAAKETMALVLTYPGGIRLKCKQHTGSFL